ncbi:hypothetical protein HZB69_03425 [Candidatus Amesbacteria bacterium]|nr:hypothetical protein [Candidatus Amesbacteria bacterium]
MIFTIIHATILWILQFSPYPELFIYPYLTTNGLLPYKQILDQHFPGLMFFLINFHSLGFSDPQSFHILLILIAIINSVWVYKISKSQLAVFFYMLWQPFFEGNQLWLDQFLPLFTLPAFWFFTNNKLALSGLLLGFGVVFKQTLIPLVAFAGIYLLFQKKFRDFTWFGIMSVLPSLVMLLYFYSKGILTDFWYWTVQFNLSTYASGGRLAPTFSELLKLSLPVLIIIFAWIRSKNRKYLFLLIGWMLFSIIGGIARFGFIHLQSAIPYFSIICGLAFIHLWKINKKIFLVLTIICTLWIGWFYLKQKDFFTTRFFEPESLRLVSEIKNVTEPGDKIFLLGIQPHFYALTNTLPAGNIFVFQFPWFLEKSGSRILVSLKKESPKLVVYDSSSQIDGLFLRNYADYLVRYVEENFVPVKSIGTITIYESRN